MTQSDPLRATGHARAQLLPRLDAADIMAARQHHSLVELLERHGITAAGSGSRRTARCPFHDDQSPSLSVYLESNRYYCFACGASGDAITLVQRLDGLDFRAAVTRLTQSTGTSPSPDADVTPGDAISSTGSTNTQDTIFHGPSEAAPTLDQVKPALQTADLLTIAAALYQVALTTSQEAQTYLRERGIKVETARRMHVGYGRLDALRDFLGDAPALTAQAQAIGLLDAFGKERLAGRIIIPEIREGRCMWMVGRTLASDAATRILTDKEQQEVADHLADHPMARTTTPKYLGVTASKPLMGIGVLRRDGPSANRRPARASRSAQSRTNLSIGGVIVVEGPFDLLAVQQWRLPLPCVALVGAHASHQQLTELIAFAAGRPIWLALDADPAGATGAEHLRVALTAARYPGPLYRLNPPLGAKDFGEVAGTPAARKAVLRALAHPEECAFISSGASRSAPRNRAVEASL